MNKVKSTSRRWVRYINNQFIGAPQTKKGSGEGWMPVIAMGVLSPETPSEVLVKDETENICYSVYVPNGTSKSAVTIKVTKN